MCQLVEHNQKYCWCNLVVPNMWGSMLGFELCLYTSLILTPVMFLCSSYHVIKLLLEGCIEQFFLQFEDGWLPALLLLVAQTDRHPIPNSVH